MIVHCIDTPNDDGVLMRTPVLTSRVEDGERIWRADLEYGSNLLQESRIILLDFVGQNSL